MKIFQTHVIFLLIWNIFLLCDSVTPGCSLPSVLRGSWAMTRFGLTGITFNDTHILQYPVNTTTCQQCATAYDFYCFNRITETQFVFRSVDRIPIVRGGELIYMCLDLDPVDKSTVVVYELTPSTRAFGSNRMTHDDKTTNRCQLDTSGSPQTLLIKLDSLEMTNKVCPSDILGRYKDTTSSCRLTIDVCTDNTAIALSGQTDCSTNPFFTDGSSVKCLHGVVKHSTTYLMIYNNGTVTPSTTEPFTCLAIQKTGHGVNISQNPRECLWNQTADSSTPLGKLAFDFSYTKLCPILNSTTSTTPTDLEPATIALISVGVFLLLLLLLLLIILLCWWLAKRRKKKRQKENEDKRALSPIRENTDSGSVDSGFSPDPTARVIDENVESRAEREMKHGKRKRHRKIRRKRRIIGPNGEVIYEESDPGDGSDKEYSDDFEEDDVAGQRGKRKRLTRKVRRYTRQRIGPDGKVITEEVESEYYETDSDGSVESWQLDPIRVQIHMAREQRKQMLQKFGHNPLFQTKSIMTRNENDRRFQLEKQKTTKEILKSEMKNKRKKNMEDDFRDDSPSNEGRRTPFMQEYEYKMSMDQRFEDEGFWDDPVAKATADMLFGLDKLDEQLDGRDVGDSERRTDVSEKDKDSQEETFKDIDDHDDLSPKKLTSAAMKSASDSSVTFPDSDAESKTRFTERSTDGTELKKDKARVRSAIRRLLTERLFGLTNGDRRSTSDAKGSTRGGGRSTKGSGGSAVGVGGSTNETGGSTKGFGESAIGGGGSTKVSGRSAIDSGGGLFNQAKPKCILVEEYNESAGVKTSGLSSDSGLPPLSGSIPPSVAPGSTSYPHTGLGVSDQSTILADGLEKDKIFIHRAQKSHIHWFKSDYNGGPERRFQKNVDDTQKLVEMVPSPYHPLSVTNPTAPLTFVSKRDVNVTKAPISYTGRSRHVDVLSMDEWRLRKLLEELYKDKKYMDLLLHKQGKPAEVKELAHYGRDYLLQIADFWESKGILAPRPEQKIPGSLAPVRSKTSLSLNVQTKHTKPDASRPSLDRNKTVC